MMQQGAKGVEEWSIIVDQERSSSVCEQYCSQTGQWSNKGMQELLLCSAWRTEGIVSGMSGRMANKCSVPSTVLGNNRIVRQQGDRQCFWEITQNSKPGQI